jgi:predicted helicase
VRQEPSSLSVIQIAGSKSLWTEDVRSIFRDFSNAPKSNSDAYVYSSDRKELVDRAKKMVVNYETERIRWISTKQPNDINQFIRVDEKILKWVRRTKRSLQRGLAAEFDSKTIRSGIYRPFYRQHHFADPIFNEELYRFQEFLPTFSAEQENRLICVSGIGSNKPFQTLIVNTFPSLDLLEKTQCFPFYTYAEDGSQRRENITDWALAEFRSHYSDGSIDKWAIFHFVYALLHHPAYREKYAANLRRSLPRIPFAPDFWPFAQAGARLAELHVQYEDQAEYPLQWVENREAAMSFRVEKMKLSRDKTSLQYNDFLTLNGIPPAVFDYKLGNRSALEWVIDRYRVTTDKRSGIVNDPNAYAENPQYIVQLIAKVVTVSVETVAIVAGLPALE